MENIQNDIFTQINSIEEFFLNSTVKIDLSSFFVSLIIAAFLAYLLKKAYMAFSQSLSNRDYFSDIFVPLSLVTCVVITVIKFSLALSLGLVGALSIVRFRAAIKEPEELVYLFFAIGIGLATGANQNIIAIVSTIFVIVILYAQSFFKRSKIEKIELHGNNVMQIDKKNKKLSIEKIIKNFDGLTNYMNLKSSYFDENKANYIFWLEFKNKKSHLKALEISNNISNKDLEISFYSNSQNRE